MDIKPENVFIAVDHLPVSSDSKENCNYERQDSERTENKEEQNSDPIGKEMSSEEEVLESDDSSSSSSFSSNEYGDDDFHSGKFTDM